jgi:hypothetical protein
MHHMIARRDAAQAALDRFAGKPFTWGKYDCVRLAAFAARQLGHKVNLLKAGPYGTEVEARAALAKAGYASLEAALDARFPRIAPAAALPGDIVAVEGKEGDWPCLMVALGNGATVGFHEGEARLLRTLKPLLAWRVDPVRPKRVKR